MDDFASAAMLRLIGLGLARQRLPVPAALAVGGRRAHVPLAHKRALVDGLLAAHGPMALLRIGEAIADAPDEPALLALALAADPHDLLARWQRLERFVHARHRLRLCAGGPAALHLQHVSLAAQAPPTRAEDLLVLGLLVAIAAHIGTPGLRVVAGTPAQWVWQTGAWTAAPGTADPAGPVATWHWQWQPRPPHGGPAGPGAAPPADWHGAAVAQLAADPGRMWSVGALAAALGCSPRTLQRRLAGQGHRFSHLLLDVRLAQSARLLATTPQPPAAIGYHCGFADQAHFGRAFKQHAAMTPVQYRQAFGTARGGQAEARRRPAAR